MSSNTYICKHHLKSMLGDLMSASLWGFCFRNLNHAKNIRVEYDIGLPSDQQHRFVFAKGYRITSVVKLMKNHKKLNGNSRVLWLGKCDEIIDLLNDFRLGRSISNEMV